MILIIFSRLQNSLFGYFFVRSLYYAVLLDFVFRKCGHSSLHCSVRGEIYELQLYPSYGRDTAKMKNLHRNLKPVYRLYLLRRMDRIFTLAIKDLKWDLLRNSSVVQFTNRRELFNGKLKQLQFHLTSQVCLEQLIWSSFKGDGCAS